MISRLWNGDGFYFMEVDDETTKKDGGQIDLGEERGKENEKNYKYLFSCYDVMFIRWMWFFESRRK